MSKPGGWDTPMEEYEAGLDATDLIPHKHCFPPCGLCYAGECAACPACRKPPQFGQRNRTPAISKREKSVCLRKNGYSESLAKAKAAYSCASAVLPDLHAYACPYCQYWHLSSRNWDGSKFTAGDNGYFASDAGVESCENSAQNPANTTKQGIL